MQQEDLIGIFNLLSIRRSSDLTSTFPNVFSFISQIPTSGNTLVLHQGPSCSPVSTVVPTGTASTGVVAVGIRTGLTSPGCGILHLTSWAHLPQLLYLSTHIGCYFFLPVTTVQVLSSLGSDTKISLSVSAFLFFVMSWLQIQHNSVSGKTWPFNIKFVLERIILVDSQSLGLFLICSTVWGLQLWAAVRTWPSENELPPTKMKDLTSAHSKMLHLSFWFLL